MSRPKGIIKDEPFAGVKPEERKYFELAAVQGVNPVNRTVDITFSSEEGGRLDVPVIHSSGNYTMPMQGDSVVVIYDRQDRPVVIGSIDPDYGLRLANNLVDTINPGEVAFYGRMISADDTIHAQRLVFRQNGDIILDNPVGEGIILRTRDKIMYQRAQTIRQETVAGTSVNGMVLREIPPIPDLQPVGLGTVPIPFVEQGFDSVEPITRLRRARFVMGDIFNDLGIPEVGIFGQPLRVLLEAVLSLVPQARFEIDIQGNISLTSVTGQIQISSAQIINLLSTLITITASTLNISVSTAMNITSPVPPVVNAAGILLGLAGDQRPVARIGDRVQVVVGAGSSAGTWSGEIIG